MISSFLVTRLAMLEIAKLPLAFMREEMRLNFGSVDELKRLGYRLFYGGCISLLGDCRQIFLCRPGVN